MCLKYLHGAAKDGAQINCCFQFGNTIAQITCSFALINHSAIWTPYISLSYHLPFYAYILSFNISNLLLHITHHITDWKTVIDVLPSAKNCFILGTAHTEIVKQDSLVYVMFFAIIMFQWVDTHLNLYSEDIHIIQQYFQYWISLIVWKCFTNSCRVNRFRDNSMELQRIAIGDNHNNQTSFPTKVLSYTS